MSFRGTFSGAFGAYGLRDTPKTWRIGLIESKIVWFELAVRSLNEHIDVRDILASHVAAFKETYDELSSRRIIYFICTRPRVRLAAKDGARITRFRGRLSLELEVGTGRRASFVIPRADLAVREGEHLSLPVQALASPTSVTLIYPDGLHAHFPIHDFLMMHGINLGYASKVEYVGYTKNPDTRPLDGKHRGLTETIYKAGPAAEDIFIYYNTFNVMVSSSNPEYAVKFELSNASIGEVDEDTEGRVVESTWIDYFHPATQIRTTESERVRFSALKKMLHQKHRVVALDATYEVDSSSDYFTLWSDSKIPTRRHHARYELPD